ncbi:MAG: hypothetical protein Ct9H300mP23_10880 [Nitrospinota bacterium]|nr:MAG: hypothetical protein Ct9H300mP23_10880 [Nitrospinota bacterium]
MPIVGKVHNLVEGMACWNIFLLKKKSMIIIFNGAEKIFLRNQPRIDIPETETNSTLNLERHLVHLILSGKERAQKKGFKAVNLEDFSNPALKSIATTCLQMIEK